MAYSIKEKNGAIVTWHVNQEKPKTAFTEIKSLQADGDELMVIATRFTNVPYSHPNTIWKGEMANFIFDNL